jgi:hypothetical protein
MCVYVCVITPLVQKNRETLQGTGSQSSLKLGIFPTQPIHIPECAKLSRGDTLLMGWRRGQYFEEFSWMVVVSRGVDRSAPVSIHNRDNIHQFVI